VDFLRSPSSAPVIRKKGIGTELRSGRLRMSFALPVGTYSGDGLRLAVLGFASPRFFKHETLWQMTAEAPC
jgi:hypothetical protein